MTKPFKTQRADGRSDRQIIIDLVHAAAPGTLYSYEELAAALAAGLDGEAAHVGRARVYRAVALANPALLADEQRYLRVTKNKGYQILHATEHLPAALAKRDIAQGYIRRGVELLRGARLDELTAAQRTLHEGQLMILAGLNQAMDESQRRHERQEQVIDDLRQRIERLEVDSE